MRSEKVTKHTDNHGDPCANSKYDTTKIKIQTGPGHHETFEIPEPVALYLSNLERGIRTGRKRREERPKDPQVDRAEMVIDIFHTQSANGIQDGYQKSTYPVAGPSWHEKEFLSLRLNKRTSCPATGKIVRRVFKPQGSMG